MKPIHITVGAKLRLMVIPDSDAHANGHPVLTYTYRIYQKGLGSDNDMRVDNENLLAPQRKDDPRYMGYITFEQPGKLFTYTADGHRELSGDEVEEIIEQINEYRDSPQMWSIE